MPLGEPREKDTTHYGANNPKIIPEIYDQLKKEGKTSAAIARHFKCSPAAICKFEKKRRTQAITGIKTTAPSKVKVLSSPINAVDELSDAKRIVKNIADANQLTYKGSHGAITIMGWIRDFIARADKELAPGLEKAIEIIEEKFDGHGRRKSTIIIDPRLGLAVTKEMRAIAAMSNDIERDIRDEREFHLFMSTMLEVLEEEGGELKERILAKWQKKTNKRSVKMLLDRAIKSKE